MADASKILLTEGDAPGTPASGQVALYCKTDHEYYYKDSTGTEHSLTGATGPAGTGITWQGTWSDAVEYVVNDAVEYNGSAYVANATSTNKVPGVDAEWDVFASKGDDGTETVTTIGALINGADAKTAPVDADYLGLMDSEATNVLKKLSWAYVKSVLKTYFDGVYDAVGAAAARAATDRKLDDFGTPDDNTDLNANTTNHGLVVKATAPAATLRNIVGIDNAETAYTNKALFDTTDPSTQAYSDTAAVGSAMTAARRDHKHAMPAAFNPAAPGAIGETTPNTIRGYNVEIFKTASADSPLTAVQCAGTIVSNYGMTDADCVISLPAAAAGYAFVAILPTVRARYFKFRAGANDKIYLLGVAGSDNGYVGVASGYATGAACSFFTFKASDGGYDWFAIPSFGSWVAS